MLRQNRLFQEALGPLHLTQVNLVTSIQSVAAAEGRLRLKLTQAPYDAVGRGFFVHFQPPWRRAAFASSPAGIPATKGKTMTRRTLAQFRSGKVGYIIMWLLGVPLPILFLIYMLNGCG